MDGIASFLAGTSDASHSSPRRLSQDPGEWAGEVIRLVSGMIPPEVPAQPQVHFNQQDEINGYAVGSIHLSDGAGDVKGFIPVIVKRFQLSPMDILVADGKFMPLTERRLRELFESTAMDDGTIDLWKVRDGSDQDLTETNPSSAGLYPYAGAPMSREDFLQTLAPSDQVELEAALRKDAGALVVLRELDKVASVHELMEPVVEPEPAEAIPTVRTFVKTGAGKYKIMTSYEGNFGPKIVETDEGGLRVSIKEAIPENRDDWLTRVHTEGTATVKGKEEEAEKNLAKEENINQGPKGGEVFLYRADRTEPEDGTEHCGCFAMTTSGQRIRGVLLPKVVDLDGKSINTKLFVGRSVAGVQPKIAVERISGTVDFKEAVEDAVPKQGETGTLVHVDDKGDAVALVPMTIDSIWTDSSRCRVCDDEDGPTGPTMTINARTMLGKKVKLVLGQCRAVVDITPQYRLTESKEPSRRRYAVPSDFSWVPMSEFKEFMTSPRVMRDAEDLEKKASIPVMRVIDTGLGYAFQAPWVKTAQALIDKQAAGNTMLGAAGDNVAATSAGQSPLPAPTAPPAPLPVPQMGKGASIDLGCLSEPEARHMLVEWGLNLPTADGVLKASSERGSLWVRGIEDPIEKLARHPFLAVPSKAKMLRAALGGLGVGALGLGAAGAAQAGQAASGMAPHFDDAMKYDPLLRGPKYQEAYDSSIEGAGGAMLRPFTDFLDMPGNVDPGWNARAGGQYESKGQNRHPRPGGRMSDFITSQALQKQNAAHPADEMVAYIRHQAKTAFPKLAYAARAQFNRAAGDPEEFAKLAESGDTIEAAMDLNFLNPQNVSYFIGLAPKLEEVMNGLGRLLVAVRIGLPDIDEEVVRSAVKQLDSILTGLRALSFAETDE